jgi:hypothetical protein
MAKRWASQTPNGHMCWLGHISSLLPQLLECKKKKWGNTQYMKIKNKRNEVEKREGE